MPLNNMITVERSSRFNRAYKKFVKHRKNPTHPGLNTEKLGGADIWTIRLSKGDRIFFKWIDETAIVLFDIGPHDKYKTY